MSVAAADPSSATVAPEHRLLIAVLRGESAAWPRDTALADRLLESCREEALGPLIHHCLHRSGAGADWPLGVRDALKREAQLAAAVDLLRENELVAVLAALAADGIECLLLKGVPLGYLHYPEPAVRTRCDTDVLVRPADRAACARALEALGYAPAGGVTGEVVSYQQTFVRQARGIPHAIDLHWQINNGQVFAQALAFDEIARGAVALPRLGPHARAPNDVLALFIAVIHRASHVGVHGQHSIRLVWHYDIDLLARALTPGQWRELVALCTAKRMCAVASDALTTAIAMFATPIPADVLAALKNAAGDEASARFLRGARSQVLLADLRVLPWRKRIELLAETAFPPGDYVMEKYGTRARWLLPWWYLRRGVEGVVRYVRASRA